MNTPEQRKDGFTEKRQVSIQLHYNKCGKPRCKTCRTGRGHGPYAYAYWTENGVQCKQYLGLDQGKVTHIRFRTQYNRCGKPNCACKTGEKHGPYLYMHWRVNGRRHKKYVKKSEVGKGGPHENTCG